MLVKVSSAQGRCPNFSLSVNLQLLCRVSELWERILAKWNREGLPLDAMELCGGGEVLDARFKLADYSSAKELKIIIRPKTLPCIVFSLKPAPNGGYNATRSSCMMPTDALIKDLAGRLPHGRLVDCHGKPFSLQESMWKLGLFNPDQSVFHMPESIEACGALSTGDEPLYVPR
mmetsp:Transcript_37741/g.94580  ORF Transcript_37741/g.94580 Transcript_37741/m.94580 type:complete len:174 (+) Transcript_37741:820-1341(+)